MLFVFLGALLSAFLSLSTVVVKCFPKQNYLLSDIISFWSIMTISSFLYSMVIFFGLNFYLFIIIFVIGSLVSTIFAANAIKLRFQSISFYFKQRNFIIPILLWIAIIIFSLVFIQHSERWGTWDSWTIWNLHAKFMMSGSSYSLMYSEPIFTARDYPLFLPSLIALFWNLTGTMSAMVPIIISYSITLSVLLVVYSFLIKINKLLSILALVVLFGDSAFVQIGAWQYADMLLSLFFLISIALILKLDENKNSLPLALLTGIFAASCGWIKNEGVLMFIIISLFFVIKYLKAYKNIIYYVLGAIIPITIILIYKFLITPPNDFISQLTFSDILTRLQDTSRYIRVSSFFIIEVLLKHYWSILPIIGALLFFRAVKPSLGNLIVLVMIVAYFFVYLITNTDLMWNLKTSGNRLFIHLFPSMIVVLMYGLAKSKNSILSKFLNNKFLDKNTESSL